MVAFNNIPNTLRVPFAYVEFDNSRAQQGPAIQEYKTLFIAQKLSGGSATDNEPYVITREEQAIELFGNGSIAHAMVRAYRANNKVTELTVIGQPDDGSGVKATGTIAFSGTATADGVVYFYVGGERYTASVANGDDATAVGAAVAAALTAADYSIVTAADVTGTVTFTAKNAGLHGNDIDIRLNYNDNEELPAGITAVVTGMASGAANPDVADAIANMPEEQYQLIGHVYTDAPNLTALETELADRFGPIRQNDGYAMTSKRDTLSGLASLGNGRNSQFTMINPCLGPSSPWDFVAASVGTIALAAQADPARPFQTLELTGLSAPTETERFQLEERNNLLYDGVMTWKVAAGGVVRLERVITTYKQNDAGANDTSYLDLNTLLTLSYLRFSFRNLFLSRYPRHKLANDNVRYAQGQPVLTPKTAKAEAVQLFQQWENSALVEGIEQFKRDIIVERNAQDPNRLDFLLPPDTANQLRVLGAQIQFLL